MKVEPNEICVIQVRICFYIRVTSMFEFQFIIIMLRNSPSQSVMRLVKKNPSKLPFMC